MLSVSAELYADIYISPAEARAAACTCKWASRHISVWNIFTKRPFYTAPHNPNNTAIRSRQHTYIYDTGPSKIRLWYDNNCIALCYRPDRDTIVGYSPATQLYAVLSHGDADHSTVVWLWRVFGLPPAEMPLKLG